MLKHVLFVNKRTKKNVQKHMVIFEFGTAGGFSTFTTQHGGGEIFFFSPLSTNMAARSNQQNRRFIIFFFTFFYDNQQFLGQYNINR